MRKVSHIMEISVPKPTPLLYETGSDGCCQMYVALPDHVSKGDLYGFRELNGELPFEILDNPSQWLAEGGRHHAPGVSKKSQVIIIAQHLYDYFKKVFYPWLRSLISFRREQKQAIKQGFSI